MWGKKTLIAAHCFDRPQVYMFMRLSRPAAAQVLPDWRVWKWNDTALLSVTHFLPMFGSRLILREAMA